MQLNKSHVLLTAVFLTLQGSPRAAEPNDSVSPGPRISKNPPVKIGFFYGGRTNVVYRAFVDGYFGREGLEVELLTRLEKGDGWSGIPQNYETTKKIRDSSTPLVFGRATGTEIIEGMEKGLFAGGTVGESSFISACARGLRIQAVALLGHDSAKHPAKCLVVRSGVTIKDPKDFKGKRIASRRAGPGDGVYVREFVASIGLDPAKDVTLIEQMPLGRLHKYLKTGKADAALFHMYAVQRIERDGIGYIYRPMDWINPEIAQGLLVFRSDFIEQHPGSVKKFVAAYMKKLKIEKSRSVSDEEKFLHAGDLGTQVEYRYKDLSMPVYDYPPLMRPELAEEMQRLLFKYGEIAKKADLKGFINNDFVKEIYEELK